MYPKDNFPSPDAQLEPTPDNPVCLALLLDVLDVLEPELNELPEPTGLFASELRRTLIETLGVPSDDH